jgi:hypothetical protein
MLEPLQILGKLPEGQAFEYLHIDGSRGDVGGNPRPRGSQPGPWPVVVIRMHPGKRDLMQRYARRERRKPPRLDAVLNGDKMTVCCEHRHEVRGIL